MRPAGHLATILMADDDADDRMLARDALREAKVPNEVHFVVDGQDLLDYLYRRGRHAVLLGKPLPGLILLDLNMPRKNGLEALEEIRADPHLRTIPVVVLTTSESDEDLMRSYDLGCNSFITKPPSFEGLISVMRSLKTYWLETVRLPLESAGA